MNEIRLARHAAEALFRALDKGLHVELFLVGILPEDTADPATPSLFSRRIAASSRRGQRCMTELPPEFYALLKAGFGEQREL